MAQFRGTIYSGKGETSRLGHRATGMQVVLNGWHGGVSVVAQHVNGKDVFSVFKTGGANGDTEVEVFTFEVEG